MSRRPFVCRFFILFYFLQTVSFSISWVRRAELRLCFLAQEWSWLFESCIPCKARESSFIFALVYQCKADAVKFIPPRKRVQSLATGVAQSLGIGGGWGLLHFVCFFVCLFFFLCQRKCCKQADELKMYYVLIPTLKERISDSEEINRWPCLSLCTSSFISGIQISIHSYKQTCTPVTHDSEYMREVYRNNLNRLADTSHSTPLPHWTWPPALYSRF